MATSEILLRYNSTNKNNANPELEIFHARPTDATRSKKTYDQRKKAHKKITNTFNDTLHNDPEQIYQFFCDELNDVYDHIEFVYRCYALQTQIQQEQRFKEYCFAKLASLCTHEPMMCTYINDLLSGKKREEEQIAASDSVENVIKDESAMITAGENVLIDMIRSLQKEHFFYTLHTEHQHDTSSLKTDSVTDLLVRIQRNSGRSYVKEQHKEFYHQQENLVQTAENIEEAIKTIHLFAWDSLNREQKFIQKIMDALQSSNQEITIACGIGLNRKTYSFNRDQLLVCIRSNPSLCVEFNKALQETKKQRHIFSFTKTVEERILPSNSDQKAMFDAPDDQYVNYAIKLVASLEPTLQQEQEEQEETFTPSNTSPESSEEYSEETEQSNADTTESLGTEFNGAAQDSPHSTPTALVNLSGQFRSFQQTNPMIDKLLNILKEILAIGLAVSKTPSLLDLQQYSNPSNFFIRSIPLYSLFSKPQATSPQLLIKNPDHDEPHNEDFVETTKSIDTQPVEHIEESNHLDAAPEKHDELTNQPSIDYDRERSHPIDTDEIYSSDSESEPKNNKDIEESEHKDHKLDSAVNLITAWHHYQAKKHPIDVDEIYSSDSESERRSEYSPDSEYSSDSEDDDEDDENLNPNPDSNKDESSNKDMLTAANLRDSRRNTGLITDEEENPMPKITNDSDEERSCTIS